MRGLKHDEVFPLYLVAPATRVAIARMSALYPRNHEKTARTVAPVQCHGAALSASVW